LDSNGASQRGADELDPVIATVLLQLWEASQDPAGKSWSLAKLSKRAQVPMSTLRRGLTQLDAAGLVDVVSREDGTGAAALNVAGWEFCAALFGRQ
jgi:DNA-binding IclR family transcriptional regulator